MFDQLRDEPTLVSKATQINRRLNRVHGLLALPARLEIHAQFPVATT